MLNKKVDERKQHFMILLVPLMLEKKEYVLSSFLDIESKLNGFSRRSI